MVGQVLRYVIVMISIVCLTLTSALQFTHDLQHQNNHECTNQPVDSKGHHPDVCALCWFVAHQLSNEFMPVGYLPAASEQIFYSSTENDISIDAINVPLLIRNGRAPPFSVYFLG